MSPDSKQCRACCNLDSVLTTGYLSYLNERREVNLYIQLVWTGSRECFSISWRIDIWFIDLALDRVSFSRSFCDWLTGPKLIRFRLPCRPIVATISVGSWHDTPLLLVLSSRPCLFRYKYPLGPSCPWVSSLILLPSVFARIDSHDRCSKENSSKNGASQRSSGDHSISFRQDEGLYLLFKQEKTSFLWMSDVWRGFHPVHWVCEG